MTIEIVKGATFEIRFTIYSYWSGEVTTSILANLTGATGTVFFKDRPTDADADALFTKAIALVDAVNGICKCTVAASDTNDRSQQKVYYEAVIKMADGSYIRTGVEICNLAPNVGKILP